MVIILALDQIIRFYMIMWISFFERRNEKQEARSKKQEIRNER